MWIGVEILPNSSNSVIRELSTILEREIKSYECYGDLLIFDAFDIVEDVTRIILFSRSVKTVYAIPLKFIFEKPEDLYKNTLEANWSSFFDPSLTFAVVPLTTTIDRVTVGKHVGQGIVDSFLNEINQRPKVNLRSPDIKIVAKIIDNKCVLGIDLIGFQLNNYDAIVSRLPVLTFDISETKSYSEIYHFGICESAYEILKFVPLKDRIVNTTFVSLKIIDQEKILRLLTTKWKKKSGTIICFDDYPDKIEFKYDIKSLDITTLRDNITNYLASNLVAKFPTKTAHKKAIKKILDTIRTNRTWEKFTIFCRNEFINKFANFETKKIVSLNIRGIESSMLSMVI